MVDHFTQVTLSFAGVVTGATPDSPFSECLPSPRKWLAANGHTVHVKFAGTDAGKISYQPGPEGGPYSYFKDALDGFIEGFNDAL